MATRAKANLPVNYQEQLAKEAAEISKRIATPSGDRIRFNSNRSLITPDGGDAFVALRGAFTIIAGATTA